MKSEFFIKLCHLVLPLMPFPSPPAPPQLKDFLKIVFRRFTEHTPYTTHDIIKMSFSKRMRHVDETRED